MSSLGPDSLAIVIASKNRRDDLVFALRSIYRQRTQPDRIIVVDQSATPYALTDDDVLRYVHDPTIPGLTVARNVAIALNDCANVLFIDDDVEFVSDVVAHLRENFRAHPDAIGLRCAISPPRVRNFVEEPGFGSRIWGPWQRVFWRGFFDNNTAALNDRGEVGFAPGCAMAFRATLFETEKFDPALIDYSYGEDWEFSKRARRHGRLYHVAEASLVHHESVLNRYGQRRLLAQRWRNMLYFYDKLENDRTPYDRFWRLWWMLGETAVWLRKGYGLPRQEAKWPKGR
jgi:GT2 family glycosyltransferase